jgi:hypothetical protein
MPNGAYELDGYISIDRDTALQVRPDLYYVALAALETGGQLVFQ